MSRALREQLLSLVGDYAQAAAERALDSSNGARLAETLTRQALVAFLDTVDVVPRGHQPATLGA